MATIGRHRPLQGGGGRWEKQGGQAGSWEAIFAKTCARERANLSSQGPTPAPSPSTSPTIAAPCRMSFLRKRAHPWPPVCDGTVRDRHVPARAAGDRRQSAGRHDAGPVDADGLLPGVGAVPAGLRPGLGCLGAQAPAGTSALGLFRSGERRLRVGPRHVHSLVFVPFHRRRGGVRRHGSFRAPSCAIMHTGAEATKLTGLLMLVFSVSPILAPLAGSFIIAAGRAGAGCSGRSRGLALLGLALDGRAGSRRPVRPAQRAPARACLQHPGGLIKPVAERPAFPGPEPHRRLRHVQLLRLPGQLPLRAH